MGQLCSCARADKIYRSPRKSASHSDLLTFHGLRNSTRRAKYNGGPKAFGNGILSTKYLSTDPLMTSSPCSSNRGRFINPAIEITSSQVTIPESTADSYASTFDDFLSITNTTASAPNSPLVVNTCNNTMIRQKPPPKPPRMNPRGNSSHNTPVGSLERREKSPGISSLKSSIADVTSTLDTSLLCNSLDLPPVSRISPTGYTIEEKINRILMQTKDFLALEIYVDPIIKGLRDRGIVTLKSDMEIHKCSTLDSKWDTLLDILMMKGPDGFNGFCEVLRYNNDYKYLADLLAVLDMLVDIAVVPQIDSNSNALPHDKKLNSSCSICELNRKNQELEELLDDCSKFDIEILYMDIENGNTKPLKEIAFIKKHRLRPLAMTPEEKLLLKNEADKYIPVISISLYNKCLCNDGIDKLTYILSNYTCIREMSIAKNHLDLRAVDVLGKALHKNNSLFKLDLKLNTLDDHGAQILFEQLNGNKTLKVVNVASTELSGVGCGHLFKGIGLNPSLTDLDMGFNDIQNAGAKVIADALGTNCALKKLRMRSNYVTTDGAKLIFKSLKKNSRLWFLDMSENKIKDESMVTLSELLLCNRTLKELNLEGCAIAKNGCTVLARALKTNRTMKSLDLSMNDIQDEGVEALADGVKYNQVLDKLCLNMCGVGNSGFSKLMDSLQFNGTMTTLKLCYNNIGCPIANNGEQRSNSPVPSIREIYDKVCHILQTNKDLKVLLWGNKLDYEEAEDRQECTELSFKNDIVYHKMNTSLDSMGASSGHSNQAFVEDDSLNESLTNLSLEGKNSLPSFTTIPKVLKHQHSAPVVNGSLMLNGSLKSTRRESAV